MAKLAKSSSRGHRQQQPLRPADPKIAEGMPQDFARRFLGTHFLTAAYLQLLEIITHAARIPKSPVMTEVR